MLSQGARIALSASVWLVFASASAKADDALGMFDEGKLLATGGVSQVEGAGGGGLVPWALISGYGTQDSLGVTAHFTYLDLPNYRLISPGVSVGLYDRLEFSYAWQDFDTGKTGAQIGLGEGFSFHQNIYGAKLRLAGNAIYDQDDWLPQLSFGVQYKENDRGAIIAAIGGRSAVGTDYYFSATKLFLAQSVLADVTIRETKANQFGILGFGGDRHDAYAPQFESSLAYLLSRKFAIGGEFRTKPSNLSIAHEGDAWDVFAAWFVNKNLALTLAYADLGNIVIHDSQRGAYLSLQTGL
jgi:hypothetical protein